MSLRDLVIETEYFAKLYQIADADADGRIAGREGATFLRKSGLTDKMLEQIWEIASKHNAYLTQKEFAVAMRLVAMAQEGKPLNVEKIHEVMGYPKFGDIPVPAIFPTKISETDLQKYDTLFPNADTNQDGFVDANEARTFFTRANIPIPTLSNIWKLSDRDGDNKLSKGEFRLAMHLVYWCLQGHACPTALPASLIEQAMTAIVFTPTRVHANKGPSPFIASLIPTGSQQPGNLLGYGNQPQLMGTASTSIGPGAMTAYGSNMQYPNMASSMGANSANPTGYNVTGNMPGQIGSSNMPYGSNAATQQNTGNMIGYTTSGNTASQSTTSSSASQMGSSTTSPFASSSSPFASSQSPYAALDAAFGESSASTTVTTAVSTQTSTSNTKPSPFAASSSSPFASSHSPFAVQSIDTLSDSFGPTQPTTSATVTAVALPAPQQATSSDPFAVQSSNSTGELEWIPTEGGHNFDQSKYVYQHNLPGTTFEMRANFLTDLNSAVGKVKQKKNM